jgi:streptogramin lyase
VQALEDRYLLSTLREFPVPPHSRDYNQDRFVNMTAGPDGNVWFIDPDAGVIERIAPDGSVTMGPSALITPRGITTGPDGNIWAVGGAFVDARNFREVVARITPDGNVSRYQIFHGDDDFTFDFINGSWGPALGPDGNLWYSFRVYDGPGTGISQGRVTLDGTVIDPPRSSFQGPLTTGPDGALWIGGGHNDSHSWVGVIERITGVDQVTDFPVPGAVLGITAGPDGNVWFTELTGDIQHFSYQVGVITPDGQVTEYPIPTPNSAPRQIAAGPDGNLWFTEFNANQIGMITPDGQITEYPIPTPNSKPEALTAGADGNIWFTEFGSNQMGEVVLSGGAADAASGRLAARDALFAGARPPSGSGVSADPQPVGAATAGRVAPGHPEAGVPPKAQQALPESGTRHLPQAREKRDVANTLGEPMLEVV